MGPIQNLMFRTLGPRLLYWRNSELLSRLYLIEQKFPTYKLLWYSFVHYHIGTCLFSRNRGIPNTIRTKIPNFGPNPDHLWHFGPDPNQSVTFVKILIRMNVQIYSYQQNYMNEYPNIFILIF